MAITISLSSINSSAMAASLRFPLQAVLSPKRSSFGRLLSSQYCYSFPAIACARIPNPAPYRMAFVAFYPPSSRLLACVVKYGTADPTPENAEIDEELLARGESTMPERFRHLTKEVPDPPLRWPWAIVLFFLVYQWRTVLWELSNWKKAATAIISAFGWLMKLSLAFLFRYVGRPVTHLLGCVEYVQNAVRYAYASIVAFAPVPELTRIILFASTVLAIAEATVPESVNEQYHLLAVAGILGFGAVQGLVSDLPFWLSLFVMFCYSRVVRKRDGVSAALPSAALLAAVGESWVRTVVIASYLAFAVARHAKHSNVGAKIEIVVNKRKLPLPLVLASLAIGIHLAAKWIRYRHLTWMIV